jgi:hypothetical protein
MEKCHVTRVANALCCQIIEKLLLDKRVMLRDYFSVDINDEGELVSIPMLLKGYSPCLGKLPSFLLRLGPNVSLTFSLFSIYFLFCVIVQTSFVMPLFVSILPRSDDDSESIGLMERGKAGGSFPLENFRRIEELEELTGLSELYRRLTKAKTAGA